MADGGLFAGLFAHGEGAAWVTDRAFVEAMVEVEVALLQALADVDLAPAEAADELSHAFASGRLELDIGELGRGTGEQGTPVPALLRELRRHLSDATSAHLHKGATSQDVIDTAMMLVAGRALDRVLVDFRAAADACAQLVEWWRDAIVPGRTLLQQALPVTFGLKAAEWLLAIDGAREDLAAVRDRELALQFGGAVGTLASLGDRGLEVARHVSERLGMPMPELPWHAVRLRPVRLACALGTALGVSGKIGRDVVLLSQTELAEVSEGGGEGRGGSSTMPHKRNPVGGVGLVACAQRGPGLVATMLGAMMQEHERGAGGWQAEWETLLELLRLTGSSASILKELLSGLEVDSAKMRADMDLTGGLVMSESVAAALAPSVGRARAQRLVQGAARTSVDQNRSLREVLLELSAVTDVLGEDEIDAALDPAAYLGVTAELIGRALAAHRAG